MNLKHGFYARGDVNPDRRLMNQPVLSQDDLVMAERFLHGDAVKDSLYAHQVVKAIHAAGKLKYPTLWGRAKKHIEGYEFETLETLLNLPTSKN